jgi:hypothetical protein
MEATMTPLFDPQDRVISAESQDSVVEKALVPGQPEDEGSAAHTPNAQSGKVGWALLWLIGIPLPVLLILYLIFGR